MVRSLWPLLGAATLALTTTTSVHAQTAAPTVTLSGVGYAQYGYRFDGGADDANAFDVTRTYLNVNAKFGVVSSRVTPDIYRSSDGSLAFRLKYAFVAYTPAGSGITVKLGQIHTPWVDWEEALWDYRMQGPIALDRAGYLTSADLGLGVDGVWMDQGVNAQVGIYDGEGYHNGVGDKRKDIMGRVSVRVMKTDDGGRVGGLRISGYAHYGAPTGGGRRYRFVGMVSYKGGPVTAAAEAATVADSATATDVTQTTGRVFSGFAVFRLPASQVAFIGRVDLMDPDTDTDGDRQAHWIGGVSYQVAPNLRALVDLDHVRFQSVGGVAAAPSQTAALFQVQFSF